MAMIFNDGVGSSLNQTPATGAVAMFLLKRLLKQAGWTVPRSSDGSTYNSSGDQISSGSSGANGMDNAKAWFVIQQPGSSRSFCIQRNSVTGADSSKSWRIKYSKGAGFTSGSPGILQTPSATDEVILFGSGTDASPTYGVVFYYGDGLMRFHCCAEDAAPYGFMSWSWGHSTGKTCHAFGLEPLVATAAEDTDPYLIHYYQTPGIDVCWKRAAFYYGTGQIGFWMGSTWAKSSSVVPAACVGVPTGYQSTSYDVWYYGFDNFFNGKDDLLPLTAFWFYQTGGPCHYYKGVLTYSRACCSSFYRITGTLYDVAATKDGVLCGDVVMPWDGSSTPLV